MVNLDDAAQIKYLDKANMAASIESLGEQLGQAWQEVAAINVPDEYKNVRNIVVSGMGGSGLGPHLVRSVFGEPIPLQIVNDYHLPPFVDETSLVIVSSYSGNTEETLASLEEALLKRAKIVGVASGGKLIEVLQREGKPFYKFDPKYNPCGQPRTGTGYAIGAILGLLAGLGFLNFNDENLLLVKSKLKEANVSFNVRMASAKNEAKRIALSLVNKIPIVFGAEFLAGNAHIFANQINENAKFFSAYFLLPEANHHLLEGVRFPNFLGGAVKFVFLESPLYSPKMVARIKITKDVISRARIEGVSYNVASPTRLEAAFETLAFSSWASFYLAISYGIDPTPIPNVDYFKDQLAREV